MGIGKQHRRKRFHFLDVMKTGLLRAPCHSFQETWPWDGFLLAFINIFQSADFRKWINCDSYPPKLRQTHSTISSNSRVSASSIFESSFPETRSCLNLAFAKKLDKSVSMFTSNGFHLRRFDLSYKQKWLLMQSRISPCHVQSKLSDFR